MGMILTLTSVKPETAEIIRQDPDRFYLLVEQEYRSEAVRFWREQIQQTPPKPGIFKRITLFFSGGEKVAPAAAASSPDDPDLLLPLAWAEGEAASTDIDKAWHGLHFLYAGVPFGGSLPEGFIMNGDHVLVDRDAGYGPPFYYTPAQTADIAAMLNALDRDELRRRYDPAKMEREEIYPAIWEAEGDEAFDDYLFGFHESLRDFVNATAAKNMGLVIALS